MKEDLSNVYGKVFEPTYVNMLRIHTNYLDTFHRFYRLATTRIVPELDLFHTLRHYSIEYAALREDIKNLGITVKYLVTNFSNSQEKKAIKPFSRSIRESFKPATISDSRHASWCSFFLWQFEENILEQRNPFDFDYTHSIAGADPLKEFLELLEQMYTKDIPARWASVTKAKARLYAIFNAES